MKSLRYLLFGLLLVPFQGHTQPVTPEEFEAHFGGVVAPFLGGNAKTLIEQGREFENANPLPVHCVNRAKEVVGGEFEISVKSIVSDSATGTYTGMRTAFLSAAGIGEGYDPKASWGEEKKTYRFLQMSYNHEATSHVPVVDFKSMIEAMNLEKFVMMTVRSISEKKEGDVADEDLPEDIRPLLGKAVRDGFLNEFKTTLSKTNALIAKATGTIAAMDAKPEDKNPQLVYFNQLKHARAALSSAAKSFVESVLRPALTIHHGRVWQANLEGRSPEGLTGEAAAKFAAAMEAARDPSLEFATLADAFAAAPGKIAALIAAQIDDGTAATTAAPATPAAPATAEEGAEETKDGSA